MRRYLVLIALLLLVGGVVAPGASGQDAPEETDRIQSIVQPSIVYLETTYAAPVRNTNPEAPGLLFAGDPVEVTFRCTGFFVNPDGYVATAAHCILADDAGLSPGSTRASIVDEAGARGLEEGYFAEGSTLDGAIAYAREWFRVVGRIETSYSVAYPTDSTAVSSQQSTAARRIGYRLFREGDVALLKFETGGVAMPGLELAEDEEVRSQTSIFAVGFPGSVDDITDQDYNATFSNGAIQRYGTREGGTVPVYQHGAEVSGGMSGGPVVTEDGRVIGVTSFGRAGETASFNIASPVALVREVLGDKGVENDVGPVGRIYREGVDAFYEGEKGTALDRFGEVLQNYPGNPARSLASPLRARAEELPDDDGFPLWGWILIALGALAFVGVALFIVLGRRQPSRPVGTPAFAGAPSSVPPPLRPDTPPAALPPPAPRARAAETTVSQSRPAVLVVGARGETATRHELVGEMILGRDAADILLPDEQVSRRHALLRVDDDGRVEIEDLGSANGTEVNGVRMTKRVELAHGDTIRVGDTELKVELPRSTQASAPSDRTVLKPRDS